MSAGAGPPSPGARQEKRTIVAGGRRLAALVLHPAGTPRGSIAIAHPHPAHGGHMDHGVVALVAERAAAVGFVALRFDFGGVRESEGDVRDWEQHQVDLRAAHDAARAVVPEAPAFGAGYSYGARAWLEAMLREDAPRVAGLLLLAPPTRVPKTSRDFGDLLLGRPVRAAAADPRMFERLAGVPVPTRILVGEADAVAPPDEVRRHAGPLATVRVLPGLDHFFRPGIHALAPAIDSALYDLLAVP